MALLAAELGRGVGGEVCPLLRLGERRGEPRVAAVVLPQLAQPRVERRDGVRPAEARDLLGPRFVLVRVVLEQLPRPRRDRLDALRHPVRLRQPRPVRPRLGVEVPRHQPLQPLRLLVPRCAPPETAAALPHCRQLLPASEVRPSPA